MEERDKGRKESKWTKVLKCSDPCNMKIHGILRVRGERGEREEEREGGESKGERES